MKCRTVMQGISLFLASSIALVGCSGNKVELRSQTDFQEVDVATLQFPLQETTTIKGMTTFPANTESNPNNRTIFKRLQEATKVEVEWTAIQSDQWGDKITLAMSDVNTLPDFVMNAGFSTSDLSRYAQQGVILPLEDYIEAYMPNLSNILNKYPEYRTMITDSEGHIWSLPWIEQLGSGKKAIQTVGNMSFINQKWLDFLNLEIPETVEEFEEILIAFRDNAEALQKEFNIDGDIIPMSCIINDGDQDPSILINGFGEGYGDPDKSRHIAVTDNLEVISTTVQEGYKEGIQWLHSLYEQGLIDAEAFTQDWSTYVSKGKSGRYGVAFSWDIANIDNLNDWVPLPVLTADVTNLTAQNGSFTSGVDVGRAVVTAAAGNPALVCAYLDQMYDPFQSPQNNWGTYGEDDEFDIFDLGKNADGEEMLQHAPLGDASPVEVREAESVGGPLAILDEYYGVYVTTPADAQYRLEWIEEYFTPDMNHEYVYPVVFMDQEDTKRLANLQTDLEKLMNTKKADWIKNGVTDEEWSQYLKDLDAYGLQEYLEIHQKYLDAAYE